MGWLYNKYSTWRCPPSCSGPYLRLSRIFRTVDSLLAPGLTPQTSWLDRFFWLFSVFCFYFSSLLSFLVPCNRLSWLSVSFWAHENIVYHIISTKACVNCAKCYQPTHHGQVCLLFHDGPLLDSVCVLCESLLTSGCCWCLVRCHSGGRMKATSWTAQVCVLLIHGQVTIIFVVSVCLFVQSFSQPSKIRFGSN